MLLISIYFACIKTLVLKQMVKEKLDWKIVLLKQLFYVLRFLFIVNVVEYGVEIALFDDSLIFSGDYLLSIASAAYLFSFAVVQHRLLTTNEIYLHS